MGATEILLGVILLVGLLNLLRRAGTDNSAVIWRLRALEKQVESIQRHLGIQPEAKTISAWQKAALDGQKIEAIKLYREETGLGLKDAKDAVEAWLAGRT